MNIGEVRRTEIIKRIENALSPTYLEVVDESDAHMGHKGYEGGGRHFAVIISSDTLNHLSRIEAHRRIYALFTDMMPHDIHALRIVLQK